MYVCMYICIYIYTYSETVFSWCHGVEQVLGSRALLTFQSFWQALLDFYGVGFKAARKDWVARCV